MQAPLPPRPWVHVENDADAVAAARCLERLRARLPLACVLIDPKRGVLHARRDFDDFEVRTAFEMARAYLAMGPDPEELLAIGRSNAYIVRSAHPALNALAIVKFDSNAVSPATVRIILKSLLSEMLPATSSPASQPRTRSTKACTVVGTRLHGLHARSATQPRCSTAEQ